jgi:hypothetical protein
MCKVKEVGSVDKVHVVGDAKIYFGGLEGTDKEGSYLSVDAEGNIVYFQAEPQSDGDDTVMEEMELVRNGVVLS